MKKLLVLLLCLGFLSVNAQKMTKNFLKGTWVCETVEMNVSITQDKNLSIEVYSYLTEDFLTVIKYQFKKNEFYLKTLNEKNNWVAIARFIIVDENTMVADYACDNPGQLIYKRVLN
jgi:hypothetical protein